MPTGYTSFIEEGKITEPKDFLKVCLRAFGIFIDKRDETLSLESVINARFSLEDNWNYNYYKEQYEDAQKKLEEYTKPQGEAVEKAYQEFIAEIKKEREYYVKHLEEIKIKNAKYDDFINRISEWKCSPEFNEIKKFAIGQCEKSKDDIEFCQMEIDRCDEQLKEENSRKVFEKNMSVKRQCLEDNVAYYLNHLNEAVKRNQSNKEFFEKFMEELETIE